jgi:hypothetical protein
MIYSARLSAVPGRHRSVETFDTITLKSGSATTRRLLDRCWSAIQSGAPTPVEMGLARRPREEVEHLQADRNGIASGRDRANGPIVQRVANSFLQPTSFSSVK